MQSREGACPRFSDALMLMAPDHKVQEPGQIALPDAVFGVLGVRHSVLVQDKDVEPGVNSVAWAVCWPHPTAMENRVSVCYHHHH